MNNVVPAGSPGIQSKLYSILKEDKEMSKKAVKAGGSIDQNEISTVLDRTEKLMVEEPGTRNSDKLLLVRYMAKYHNIDISPLLNKEIPSPETIRRDRQRIQADGRCKPLESVHEVREENQITFRNFFKKIISH